MFKYKTLDDRQLLLEEIYAELEELLLKKEGNASEEEEHSETENNQERNIVEEEEEDDDQSTIKKTLRALQQFDPSKMTEYQKKKFIYNLLNELKEKKSLLQQSLTQINKIIQNGAI